MFPDSTDRCKECQCSNGNIQCRQKICQDVRQLCNSPAVTDCCPRCQDCQYRDQLYRDRERFPDVTDPCKECSCQKGNVNCVQKTCPATTCSHPIRDQCCPRCGSDCFYNNRMYTDKQTFRESCRTCQCDGGSVTCSDVSCPSTQCSHPVYDECCKRCDRCLFEGRIYGDGQSFQDRNDPCSACVCQSGSVTCSKKPCPDHKCSHPITTQCCPECTDCMYEGEIIRHEESKRKDECHVCTCRFGSVDCRRPECPTDICSNPYTDTCGCQRCDKCTHQGATYNNGATFPDPQDKCRRCQCLDGTVLCPKIPCRVQCTHPSASDGCCPICNDCMYENAIQRHGELFTSQLDPCQRCQCREGSVQCLKRTCRVDCSHPATTDGCCPICRDCRYEGAVQKYGSVFMSKSDPCQQCQCRDGNVNCLTIACDPVNCPRPVTRPGQCCPECQVCNFLGGVYNDGQRFTHPQDQCKTCTCFGDQVECVRPPCDTPCTYPTQGLCCPLCDNCEFEGKIRPNGATFKPDACRTCTCTNGNVKCITQSCPPLACIQQEVPEGECCPRCKSCSFSGRQYVDGSTFVLEREPCMNCLCHNTVMTCEERKCFSVCDNPVNDPNECCPVCPTCTYQGREYRDGETFSPRGDPCDICTCSEGRLKCQHTVCPRTANCPANQIIPPLPGECCPTCSGLGYNCTRADIGNVIKPRPDDACFRCECRAEKNWMCTYEPCPSVNCPASVWIKPQGQCCPTCPACHDLEVDRWYEEGTSWSGDNDPCVHCECRGGDVFCQVIGCPAVVCNREQRFVKPKGKCCAMCEDIPAVPCQYNSAVYQAGESWRVDDCTDCRCLGGVVECLTQTCPPLDCDPSDVATATPGSCCPVCITKPGTCLVFGDPHYYTFDGTTIHFQGFCKYTMATDCVNNDFVVDVHHDNRGAAGHVSWAQNFTITLGRSVIELLQNHIVEVDGRRVELPFFNKNFSVEHTQDTVLFNTKIGVKLVWNGNSYAELSVPGTYRNKLCGLCGNFNGFPMDDMKTKGRRITNSPSIFGNSWKTLQQENEFCEDGTDLDPCVEAGYRARKFATTQCSILRGPKFSHCHRAVAPDPFYAACVYDLCVCGDNSTCLCDILSSYAKECAKVGVRLEWREAGLCDFGCDESLGFVFDECGPVCPRTCENYDTPLGDLKTNCFKPCIASCQCPADKVLLNGRCVPFDQCPRIDRGDIPVGPAQG